MFMHAQHNPQDRSNYNYQQHQKAAQYTHPSPLPSSIPLPLPISGPIIIEISFHQASASNNFPKRGPEAKISPFYINLIRPWVPEKMIRQKWVGRRRRHAKMCRNLRISCTRFYLSFRFQLAVFAFDLMVVLGKRIDGHNFL